MTHDIIIPHYGTGNLTALCLACLESVRRYSADYRLIFVDNASPEFDSVAPELDRHPHLLIRNTRNLGFVKAVNLALMMAEAPYVVLLNNDTEAAPEWLEKLRAPLAADAHISGPRTTTPNSWQGRAPAVPGYRVLPPGHMLAFFCTMFRREVFDRAGLLDEDFGVGLGDDDHFCWKAESYGFRLALVSNLVIPHHHRSTFSELYEPAEISGMQSRAMEMLRRKQAEATAELR